MRTSERAPATPLPTTYIDLNALLLDQLLVVGGVARSDNIADVVSSEFLPGG